MLERRLSTDDRRADVGHDLVVEDRHPRRAFLLRGLLPAREPHAERPQTERSGLQHEHRDLPARRDRRSLDLDDGLGHVRREAGRGGDPQEEQAEAAEDDHEQEGYEVPRPVLEIAPCRESGDPTDEKQRRSDEQGPARLFSGFRLRPEAHRQVLPVPSRPGGGAIVAVNGEPPRLGVAVGAPAPIRAGEQRPETERAESGEGERHHRKDVERPDPPREHRERRVARVDPARVGAADLVPVEHALVVLVTAAAVVARQRPRVPARAAVLLPAHLVAKRDVGAVRRPAPAGAARGPDVLRHDGAGGRTPRRERPDVPPRAHGEETPEPDPDGQEGQRHAQAAQLSATWHLSAPVLHIRSVNRTALSAGIPPPPDRATRFQPPDPCRNRFTAEATSTSRDGPRRPTSGYHIHTTESA